MTGGDATTEASIPGYCILGFVWSEPAVKVCPLSVDPSKLHWALIVDAALLRNTATVNWPTVVLPFTGPQAPVPINFFPFLSMMVTLTTFGRVAPLATVTIPLHVTVVFEEMVELPDEYRFEYA